MVSRRRVTCKICSIRLDVAVYNIPIDIDVAVFVVDIDVPVYIDVNISSIDVYPARAVRPTVIIDSRWSVVAVIIIIAVEP